MYFILYRLLDRTLCRLRASISSHRLLIVQSERRFVRHFWTIDGRAIHVPTQWQRIRVINLPVCIVGRMSIARWRTIRTSLTTPQHASVSSTMPAHFAQNLTRHTSVVLKTRLPLTAIDLQLIHQDLPGPDRSYQALVGPGEGNGETITLTVHYRAH